MVGQSTDWLPIIAFGTTVCPFSDEYFQQDITSCLKLVLKQDVSVLYINDFHSHQLLTQKGICFVGSVVEF